MIELYTSGAYLIGENDLVKADDPELGTKLGRAPEPATDREGTMAWSILKAHNHADTMDALKIRFNAMASHDITYVGIIQTAIASGLDHFPIPYVLTNCHNSLCAVGGTINQDDHVFGLSAAKRFGGIFVPPHIAVIHQYMREVFAGCGKMIIGSDSHTRYGALGTMAMGEGGGELVKQLLEDTYDIAYPGVVAVYLKGKPRPGVGPHDIALAIIGAVYGNGYVKNKVMEFVGPGIAGLSTDYRNSIDVMTTETTCLSSIWCTDDDTKRYLEDHGRADDYRKLAPAPIAYYDGAIVVDLSDIKPMIALPFHPSNVYTIDDLNANLTDILRETEKKAQALISNPNVHVNLLDKVENGRLRVQQGIIAGCAGGNHVNIMAAAHILGDNPCGNGYFELDVYPSSQPVYLDLVRNGTAARLLESGAVLKTAFCGPCFGAGDTPANNALSIRHTTRNFPNREGSKPGDGQLSEVALVDARSIAASAVAGGYLTSAESMADDYTVPDHEYDDAIYRSRIYNGFGRPDTSVELVYGPNIKPWPKLPALADNILLQVVARIMDPVTTTDELIPSGETSSLRSNPLKLAEYTLSRRDPAYVGRAKQTAALEQAREAGEKVESLAPVYAAIRSIEGCENIVPEDIEIGSTIYAVRPGDGSAREQAASCQRVLGGLANICNQYATKRYRSNVMNWGMVPFQMEAEPDFDIGDWIFVPSVREAVEGDGHGIIAYVIDGTGTSDRAEMCGTGARESDACGTEVRRIELSIAPMTAEEKAIVKSGCLINFNRMRRES